MGTLGASPYLRSGVLRLLLALSILAVTCAIQAQMSPIPWRPKVQPPPPKEAQAPAPGAKTPPSQEYHLSGDHFQTLDDGVYLVEGNVRFVHPEMLLTADSVTYDTNKETLWATGDVSVDWGDMTVSGTELHYDVKAAKGRVLDAYAVQKKGEFTIIAEEIHRIEAEWYQVIRGVFTSCSSARNPWSMKISKGRFHVDHYAYLTNTRFRILDAPIIWLPYLVWPIKPERSSGMLIPEIGASSKKGLTIGTALFLAPSHWWDDTIYLDYFEKEGFGIGEEFRYALSATDYGWFHGYFIDQKSDGRKRWEASWTHLQQFGKKWRLLADINLMSDIDFPRDYGRDFVKATRSWTDSRIFLTREWGPYKFNAKVERRLQYFTGYDELTNKTLPEFELRSTLQPIGKGLYFGFETSAAAFTKEFGLIEDTSLKKHSISYQRLDLHPYFERPLHPAPWLDITPRLDLRATGYSNSLKEDGTGGGGDLWRTLAGFTLDMSGPRLFRDFDGGSRHVVEPYIRYRYLSDDPDAPDVILYDEVDVVLLDQSLLRYGVRNRFYDSKGKLRGEAELYQDKSFKYDLSRRDDRTSSRSPVYLLLRAWPKKTWSMDLRLRYDILRNTVGSSSVSVTYKPRSKERDNFFRLTYLRAKPYYTTGSADPEDDLDAQDIRLAMASTLLDGRVTLHLFLERDMVRQRWRHQKGIFWYHGSCYSLGCEVGRREIGDYTETGFRFLVSLKGAGTVVDLQSQVGEYGQ